jgi:hypothetical protein
VINFTVIMQRSAQEMDVTQTSMEGSSGDCKLKNLYCWFV